MSAARAKAAAGKPLDPTNVRMPMGKHRGELVTRLPLTYLRWLANERGHSMAAMAKAELDRRGCDIPTVEITNHAINRASQRVLPTWERTRKGEEEGLHTWLCRQVTEALRTNQEPVEDAYLYNGMKLVIRQGAECPVLVTVSYQEEPPK